MKRRVAITGLGATCGLGINLDEVWNNALAGKSGISTLENVNLEGLAVTFGGQIKNFELDENIFPEKEAKRYGRFIQLCLHSAFEAYKDSGLDDENPYDPKKIGCITGVGIGGLDVMEANYDSYLKKGARRISPFFIPGMIPNMSSGLISILKNVQGVNYTAVSACASSAHALANAATEIMLGHCDVVVTGGSESAFTPLAIGGFQIMKALSRRSDEPEKASRPFDTGRDGFVMGEGAGFLILEDLEKAKARGARIYAEVVGFGASSDAHHITAPHPDGVGAESCMRMAIERSGLDASEIGYVNAHGTSTPLGDAAETRAIHQAFGDHAKNLLVSSTKSMTGHLLGAAGGLESIFCVKSLYEQKVPPTINLDDQDPACDLNYVPHKGIDVNINAALNNSFGFGGTNSSTVFKKYNA